MFWTVSVVWGLVFAYGLCWTFYHVLPSWTHFLSTKHYWICLPLLKNISHSHILKNTDVFCKVSTKGFPCCLGLCPHKTHIQPSNKYHPPCPSTFPVPMGSHSRGITPIFFKTILVCDVWHYSPDVYWFCSFTDLYLYKGSTCL